jgi:type IV secretion system protein VirB5
MAGSEEAYNSISNRIEIYESLMEELNNTQDLKASVDLQARIAAENGLILNEIMRLQAMQIQQQTAADNETLIDYRHSSTANQYDPAKAKEAMKLTP